MKNIEEDFYFEDEDKIESFDELLNVAEWIMIIVVAGMVILSLSGAL